MNHIASPQTDDAGLEPALAGAAVAPRVKLSDLDAAIVREQFIRVEGTTLTLCILHLRNGFTLTGESAAASPENFDANVGQSLARAKARDKLWPLLGYALKERLCVENIARVAHEVNRAYCAALGDESQPAWEHAPQWQKDSAATGARMHLANPGATPEQSHESWLAQKAAEGWKWGPVKDPEKKEHPCFVPYSELPESQRAKDYLFRGVVHALRPQA